MNAGSRSLALAVLALLAERPRHPYEIAETMRRRHLAKSIKLNYGSLYHTVDSLEEAGLIAPLETERQGRRPERTVYGLTEAGRASFHQSLRQLIGQPAKEYCALEAGLCFLGQLSPTEAVASLKDRARGLEETLSSDRELLRTLPELGLTRLALLEIEHSLVVREAELAWLRQLVDEIEAGRMEWRSDRQATTRETA